MSKEFTLSEIAFQIADETRRSAEEARRRGDIPTYDELLREAHAQGAQALALYEREEKLKTLEASSKQLRRTFQSQSV